MGDVRSLRPEDYKCWICLETEAGEGSTNEWRRTCRCNLVAHETCLLQWANELAVSGDSVKVPVCPQCRKPIVIVQGKSLFLRFRDDLESANSTSIKLLMGAAIGGSALTALYTTLYTLGAYSIRFMCSPEMALDILGIVIKSTGIEIHPVSFRKAFLIPAIPIALIASRSSSKVVDLLLCLLPLALADKTHPPWKFSGPRLTVSLLPYLRLVYFRLYKFIAQPIVDSSARKMRTSDTRPTNNGIGIEGLNFGVEVVVEEDILPENRNRNRNNDGINAQAEGGNNEGFFGNLTQLLVDWMLHRVQDNNQDMNRGDLQDEDEDDEDNDNEDQPLQDQVNDNDVNDANDVREEPQLLPQQQQPQQQQQDQPAPLANGHANPRAPRIRPPPQAIEDTNWVISRRRLSLTIGNALLLPLLCNLFGLGISSIPLVQRLVPDQLQRNVLGGIMVIGIKDTVNVVTSYLRMRQEQSTRVLQYDEVERLTAL